MSDKVSKTLRLNMKIFKVFGYCTLSFDENLKRDSRRERWLTFYTIGLLISFNVIAILAFTIHDVFLFTNDIFGYFNDILKVTFADIAVTISFLESIFKRNALYEFWRIYECLQKKKPDEASKEQYMKAIWKNRRFLGIFYTLVVLELTVLLIFINTQDMSRHLVLFWGIFTPFIYAVHIRNLQFIFYIELMRIELVKLKQDLSLMVDYSRFVAYGCGFKGFEEFLRAKLVEKQRNYQMIYEMYEQFQKSFGFSIIFVLLKIYIRVLVDAYFGYYTLYRGWNKTELLMLIPACLEIPAFLITSKNCMDVVKLITHNLHSIITQFDNQNIVLSTQLQNFSLQILHQKICINGVGISRMDGYMLTRTIGSVTTYMIFFIQFMPKFTKS